jgi:endonuclease III
MTRKRRPEPGRGTPSAADSHDARRGGAKGATVPVSRPRGPQRTASRAAGPAARRVDDAAVAAILATLHDRYPDARTELRHDDPLELLVATILSAQSTDQRVNEVTRELFRKYRTAADYAAADPAVFEREIHATGFFRNKTRLVLGAARRLVETYGGHVPDTMDELVSLPGVARKTANVVLGSAFGKAEGVVVDTHVQRVAFRLGLTLEQEPAKVERELMARLPRSQWIFAGLALILHGRRVCVARKPRCSACALATWCPRNGVDAAE